METYKLTMHAVSEDMVAVVKERDELRLAQDAAIRDAVSTDSAVGTLQRQLQESLDAVAVLELNRTYELALSVCICAPACAHVDLVPNGGCALCAGFEFGVGMGCCCYYFIFNEPRYIGCCCCGGGGGGGGGDFNCAVPKQSSNALCKNSLS
jgi:hypothetical protein